VISKVAILVVALIALPAHSTIRSSSARSTFAATHACPATHKYKLPCPGYVIDHIISLDCGGRDAPSNMQWQTIAEGKAKDKWERNGPNCKHRTNARRYVK
jgi:hypothetical protein